VFNVEEQGSGFGAFMKRLFLQAYRPFTSHVEDLTQNRPMLAAAPVPVHLPPVEVRDSQGNLLGAIQRKWTWFRRKYIVEDRTGRGRDAVRAVLRPWTFQSACRVEQEVGLIQKKWSGLLKRCSPRPTTSGSATTTCPT